MCTCGRGEQEKQDKMKEEEGKKDHEVTARCVQLST